MPPLSDYLALRDLSIRAASCPDALAEYVERLRAFRDAFDEEIEHLKGGGES